MEHDYPSLDAIEFSEKMTKFMEDEAAHNTFKVEATTEFNSI